MINFAASSMAKTSRHNLQAALEKGELELKGQFRYGSNYTFLVRVHHAGQEHPAVYKPSRGQQELWDFPAASLPGRELAAYRLSEALELNFIPCTVLCEGPFGPGSLQEYIDHDPSLHYFTFGPSDRDRLRATAAFDLLVNNADRKGGHILLQKRTRRLFLIDHGLCFHAEDKLRTVVWDFAAQPIPADLLDKLEGLRAGFPLLVQDGLASLLTPGELDALECRLERLLHEPVFPSPPEDRRSYPFPPV